ncbi:hypothetical protein DEU56DRAFT_845601 [Suillus clintonianus]|uniref:uncharacterized protein n=1 Tax=Suillus clintonianus TaxID=1904413 RepID=UPI001B87A8A5|nr:uncharacterized protein DEU56DRAFT_845601 [Suillus clintonianus]KAG2157419.1 hypothetical protein DEU56DRAFT_845601 [Suillus clintonianus]
MTERSISPSEIMSRISCSATDTSEDEVVWGVSDEYSSESSITGSEADYVLLPRISVEGSDHDSGNSASEDVLSVAFDLLSVANVDDESDTNKVDKPKRTWKPHDRAVRGDSSSTSPSPQTNSGTRTLDGSYEDAAAYITQHLDAPVKLDDPSAKLRLLQALGTEFGIYQELPTSIKSARKLLQAKVHVNIIDYAAKRGKDQDALLQIMRPSKSALRRDIRRNGRKKPLKWVKEHGLNVLLIGCN